MSVHWTLSRQSRVDGSPSGSWRLHWSRLASETEKESRAGWRRREGSYDTHTSFRPYATV